MTTSEARARLGVVVPSVNTVVEPWFNAVCPAGVTVHASRMLLDSNLTAEAVLRMDREEGLHAVEQLVSCKPASIAYCCTASSIVQGAQYDDVLIHEISRIAGVPAVTATRSIITALKSFGARRIAVASPYAKEIDDAEHRFFTAAGYEILGSACLGITDSFRLADPTPREITELARQAWHEDADALLITCLNLRSHEVVEALERELGKPVVTSTQATLWQLLRTAGIEDPIAGYGRLLAGFQG
jgi:maleate isomerase